MNCDCLDRIFKNAKDKYPKPKGWEDSELAKISWGGEWINTSDESACESLSISATLLFQAKNYATVEKPVNFIIKFCPFCGKEATP